MKIVNNQACSDRCRRVVTALLAVSACSGGGAPPPTDTGGEWRWR